MTLDVWRHTQIHGKADLRCPLLSALVQEQIYMRCWCVAWRSLVSEGLKLRQPTLIRGRRFNQGSNGCPPRKHQAGRVYLGQWNYRGKCLDIIPQLVIRLERIENTWWTETRERHSVWASSISARCARQTIFRRVWGGKLEFILRSLTWDCRFYCVGRSELSLRCCWDLFWNTKHIWDYCEVFFSFSKEKN